MYGAGATTKRGKVMIDLLGRRVSESLISLIGEEVEIVRGRDEWSAPEGETGHRAGRRLCSTRSPSQQVRSRRSQGTRLRT